MLENSFLRGILISVCVGGMLWLFTQVMARQKPMQDQGESGEIAPNRLLTAAFILLCLLIGGIALWAAITDADARVPAGLIGITFLLFSGVMTTSLMPVYNVAWSEDGVTGPTSLWFPPFGPERGIIYWEKIESAGKDSMGNWFIEDASGRRIRWNFVYSGFPALMLRIEEECPWLFERNNTQAP